MPSYLTAGKIKEGMSGTISGEMYIEKKDFGDGKGEKKIAQLPLLLDQPILDGYSGQMEKDWIWSPGFNAQKLLQDELGDEMQAWINTHGSFKPKHWESKTRNGFAWHFIPDVAQPIPVPPEAAKVEAKQLADFPMQVPSTPPVDTKIECAYCSEAGDFWSTSKTENMKAHIEKFHPEKVTEESKVKARVKKE